MKYPTRHDSSFRLPTAATFHVSCGQFPPDPCGGALFGGDPISLLSHLSNPLAIVSRRGLPVDVSPYTLLVSTHWSSYLPEHSRDPLSLTGWGMALFHCLALLSPFTFVGLPIAQIPPQLSIRYSNDNTHSEASTLRTLI